jgi:hypothetical protein
VIGEATRRLVGALVTLAPLGPVTLRGRAETVAAYRVVSLERPGGASAVAFVGREEELGRLAAVYEAALAAPAARLAVVLGSPGLGKSRLLGEFTSRPGALVRSEEEPVREAVESALAQASSLVGETGAARYAPFIHLERAELARRLGDDTARRRELSEAHRLFVAMGATARAERVAQDLPATACVTPRIPSTK